MSLNAFENLTGRRFGVNVEVTGLAGRKPMLKWNCYCHRCLSQYPESHQTLINAGASYKCRNVSCALGRLVPRPKEEPEKRPDHSQDVPKKADPIQVPTVPAPAPVDPDYKRLLAAQSAWGNNPCTYADFKIVQELNPRFFTRIMAQVTEHEQQQAEQRRSDQAVAELERQFEAEFEQKYGELRVAINIPRPQRFGSRA
jgi:hypothetical protein